MLSTVDTWKNVTNGERVVRGKTKFLLYFIVKRKPYLPVLQKTYWNIVYLKIYFHFGEFQSSSFPTVSLVSTLDKW